jgi:plastocyanin
LSQIEALERGPSAAIVEMPFLLRQSAVWRPFPALFKSCGAESFGFIAIDLQLQTCHVSSNEFGRDGLRRMFRMSTRRPFRLASTLAAAYLVLAAGSIAGAADPLTVRLTIKDHQFTPAEIHVPAGTSATLIIHNEDASPEEIDSPPLKIEKIIAGGQEVTLTLHPLDKGRYPFAGEYHEDTAKGVVVAE